MGRHRLDILGTQTPQILFQHQRDHREHPYTQLGGQCRQTGRKDHKGAIRSLRFLVSLFPRCVCPGPIFYPNLSQFNPKVPPPPTPVQVTFWEALTGGQYEVIYADHAIMDAENIPAHHFHEIHTLFRHDSFLFNIQPSCSVPSPRRASHGEHSFASFDLSNPKLWLSMPLGARWVVTFRSF